MTATRGLGTTGNGAGTVTPLDHKLAQSGLVAKSGEGLNAVIPGLFYDGVSTIVSGAANMSYNVAPFTAALSRGGSAGTVLLANDGTVNVATTAAPATNSRIDIVYVWQREFSLDGTNSNPVIGVVQGAASLTPIPPSLAAFPGALSLAQIVVPAGVTATNTGTIFTQTAPFTAAAGGVLVARTQVSLPALAGFGARARVLDTGFWYERNAANTAWVLAVEDTGWITPTLAAGWTALGGETPRYRRRNGVVDLQGRAGTTGATSSAFTLPAGFRPGINVVGMTDANAVSIRYVISPSGTVGQAAAGAATALSFGGMKSFIAEA